MSSDRDPFHNFPKHNDFWGNGRSFDDVRKEHEREFKRTAGIMFGCFGAFVILMCALCFCIQKHRRQRALRGGPTTTYYPPPEQATRVNPQQPMTYYPPVDPYPSQFPEERAELSPPKYQTLQQQYPSADSPFQSGYSPSAPPTPKSHQAPSTCHLEPPPPGFVDVTNTSDTFVDNSYNSSSVDTCVTTTSDQGISSTCDSSTSNADPV